MSNLKDKNEETSENKGYKFNSGNHYHSFNDKPLLGTSTVMGIISIPLTYWASGLAVAMFGWLNPKKHTAEAVKTALYEGYTRVMGLSMENYAALLNEAYRAHATTLKSAAKSGTDLHGECERFVKNEMANKADTYDDKITPFITWADTHVEKFLWSEMNCYSDTLWVGGISDAGVLLKDGKVGILDFKSSKEAYDSQFIQEAGYDLQITENGGYTADGKKIFKLDKPISFYGIVPFGAEKFEVVMRYNTSELKEGFKSALLLYKLLNK